MIAAVEHRIVGVAAPVLELVGEDPAHDALGLRLVVGRGRDPDRVAGADSLQSFFSNSFGLLAISAFAERRMRTVDR